MTAKTFTFKLDLNERQAKDITLYSDLAYKDGLTDDEQHTFDQLYDDLTWELFNEDSQHTLLCNAKPLNDCSIVCWLPVNGTIPPVPFTDYLVSNGNSTAIAQTNLTGKWTLPKGCASFAPTYYADLPKHTGG